MSGSWALYSSIVYDYRNGIHGVGFAFEDSRAQSTQVTKSNFDIVYGCRQSLVDKMKRTTSVILAGSSTLLKLRSVKVYVSRDSSRHIAIDGSDLSNAVIFVDVIWFRF